MTDNEAQTSIPQPSEDPDTGSTGSTDERSPKTGVRASRKNQTTS